MQKSYAKSVTIPEVVDYGLEVSRNENNKRKDGVENEGRRGSTPVHVSHGQDLWLKDKEHFWSYCSYQFSSERSYQPHLMIHVEIWLIFDAIGNAKLILI